MLRRGARRARAEKLRDRGAAQVSAAAAPGRYNYGGSAPAPPPRDGKTAVRFQWAGGPARGIALVGSFDGFMHHRMLRLTAAHARAGPATFEVVLRIAPGDYTYKFLVDGVWSTDPTAPHPVAAAADGLTHHRLSVAPDAAAASPSLGSLSTGQPAVSKARSVPASPDALQPRAAAEHGRYSVVRSSSVSEIHVASVTASAGQLRHDRLGGDSASFASLNGGGGPGRAATADRLDRPSSFMVSATMSEQSPASAHRRSLLHRVGSGWMRRFSGRNHSSVGEDYRGRERELAASAPLASKSAYSSSSAVKLGGSFLATSGTGIFGADADKENGGAYSSSRAGRTPERSVLRRTNAVRGSGRASAVKISGPTMVDEPKSVEEVNRQADNWRQMARHLQESLCDPSGARELLGKAIKHREKHGLWCTVENAQTHVDLARNLSKGDRMGDAEFHLRIALRIYTQVQAGPEHIGDLLHYIGVVVDRQKKRGEAEELYRSALDTYKRNRLTGNNVEIALKNLSLNLKKQNRAHEAETYVQAYYGYVHA